MSRVALQSTRLKLLRFCHDVVISHSLLAVDHRRVVISMCDRDEGRTPFLTRHLMLRLPESIHILGRPGKRHRLRYRLLCVNHSTEERPSLSTPPVCQVPTSIQRTLRHKADVRSVYFRREQTKEPLLNEIRMCCFGGRLHPRSMTNRGTASLKN